MQHESDFDDFSVMIDHIKKKVSLLCPATVIGFNNIDDFKQFVNMLQDWIPLENGSGGEMRIILQDPKHESEADKVFGKKTKAQRAQKKNVFKR